MHPAAILQFERMIDEYRTWRAIPDGEHHHFIPVSWVDRVDQHVHLNKSGADVTSHWQHGRQ